MALFARALGRVGGAVGVARNMVPRAIGVSSSGAVTAWSKTAFQPFHVTAKTMSTSSTAKPGTVYDDPHCPRDPNGCVIHLDVKEGQIANRVLCVGDTSRCKTISKFLDADGPRFEKTSHREFHIITGTFNKVPVTIIATLMGFPNTDFVVREARSVVRGTLAMLRFGSCGGLSDTKAGDVAVATEGCISIYRNPAHWTTGEGEPYVITPPVPADSQLTELLDERVTKAVGADRVVRGINVSADTFYGSQGRLSTHFDDRNEGLLDLVEERHPSVVSCEMETNHLMDLAYMSNNTVRAAGVAMSYSNRRSRDVTTPEVVADLIDKVGLASLEALTSLPLGAEEVMDEDEFDCVWSTKA